MISLLSKSILLLMTSLAACTVERNVYYYEINMSFVFWQALVHYLSKTFSACYIFILHLLTEHDTHDENESSLVFGNFTEQKFDYKCA